MAPSKGSKETMKLSDLVRWLQKQIDDYGDAEVDTKREVACGTASVPWFAGGHVIGLASKDDGSRTITISASWIRKSSTLDAAKEKTAKDLAEFNTFCNETGFVGPMALWAKDRGETIRGILNNTEPQNCDLAERVSRLEDAMKPVAVILYGSFRYAPADAGKLVTVPSGSKVIFDYFFREAYRKTTLSCVPLVGDVVDVEDRKSGGTVDVRRFCQGHLLLQFDVTLAVNSESEVVAYLERNGWHITLDAAINATGRPLR